MCCDIHNYTGVVTRGLLYTEANGVMMASSSKCMSCTAGLKLRVIENAEQSGNRGAGREHNVRGKLVRDWRKKRAGLKALSRTRRSQRVRSTERASSARHARPIRPYVRTSARVCTAYGRAYTRSIDLTRAKR